VKILAQDGKKAPAAAPYRLVTHAELSTLLAQIILREWTYAAKPFNNNFSGFDGLGSVSDKYTHSTGSGQATFCLDLC